MNTKPLIVERSYNATIEKVWRAITDKDQMKEWYFELDEFKPVKGFKFSFKGGEGDLQYVHLCEILEVDPPNKLSHSWTYEGKPGYSVVTWELFKEGEKRTRVKLSHDGLDSFPQDDKNFRVESFTEGWNSILGTSLANYVETDIIKKSASINAPADIIWEILLDPDNTWGKAFGGGAFARTDWKAGSEIIWTDQDGQIGAKGIITEHSKNDYLQVDMYDDVNAPSGSATGEYSEKFWLKDKGNGVTQLEVESGELARMHIDHHSEAWEKAVQIIKETAESRSK